MNEKISVIIPNYNHSNNLKLAIEGCLNQTLQPIEILVCDDGSTDKSINIVKSFKDKRVKLLKLQHSGGPAKPRNLGIKNSKGNWLAFLDSDDHWMPEKLEVQMRNLKENGGYACSTNAFCKINNKVIRRKLISTNKTSFGILDLFYSNSVVCSSMILHRNLINKAGYFNENVKLRSIADYLMWLRVGSLTNILYIDSPLIIYRDEPNKSIRADYMSANEVTKVAHNNFLKWSKLNYRTIKHMYILSTYLLYKIVLKSNLLKQYFYN